MWPTQTVRYFTIDLLVTIMHWDLPQFNRGKQVNNAASVQLMWPTQTVRYFTIDLLVTIMHWDLPQFNRGKQVNNAASVQ